MITIRLEDLEKSIANALQYVSHHHPPDYVRALKQAYIEEDNHYAKNAILQILINSKLSASARRPICQDTGIAHVFLQIGMDVRFSSDEATMPSLQEVADNAVLQPTPTQAIPCGPPRLVSRWGHAKIPAITRRQCCISPCVGAMRCALL